MIDLARGRQLSTMGGTAFVFGAAAVGAVLVGEGARYPEPVKPYNVRQVSGTFNSLRGVMSVSSDRTEFFTQRISSLYAALVLRQEPLGEEFESAIFNNLEGLYEV